MNKLRSIKGITLIALVITIVILIILAGITINLIIGENGLLGKAKEAGEKSKNAANEENATLREYENWIDNEL